MLPKWILIARAKDGDWQVLASVANIREVQLILHTMLSVHEAKLCRLDHDRAIDLNTNGQPSHAA